MSKRRTTFSLQKSEKKRVVEVREAEEKERKKQALHRDQALLNAIYRDIGEANSFPSCKHLYENDLQDESMWVTRISKLCSSNFKLCNHPMSVIKTRNDDQWHIQCDQHNVDIIPNEKEGPFYSVFFPTVQFDLGRFMTDSFTFYDFCRVQASQLSFDTHQHNALELQIHIPRFLKYIEEHRCSRTIKGLNLVEEKFHELNASSTCTYTDDALTEDMIRKVPFVPKQFKGELIPGQQISVAWMNRIEHCSGQKVRIMGHDQDRFVAYCLPERYWGSHLNKYKSLIFWFDKLYKIFTISEQNGLPNHMESKQSVHYNGGILSDAMGSGKTITILAKCLLDDFSQSYFINFAKTHMAQYPTLIPTLATLVICPVGLLSEWKSRIQEFTHLDLKKDVVCIESKLDWNRLTYHDIVQARLVLVTERFVDAGKPSYYCGENDSRETNWLGKPLYDPIPSTILKLNRVHKHHLGIMKSTFNTQDPYHILGKKQIILHGFFWRRVVIDEFHRSATHSTGSSIQTIRNIESQFIWGLTATPDFSKLAKYMPFFQISTDSRPVATCNNFYDEFYFKQHHVKRFTENVTQFLPEKEENDIMLDFSAAENALYHSGYYRFNIDGNIARASHFALMNENNQERINSEPITLQQFIDRQALERKIELEKLKKNLKNLEKTTDCTSYVSRKEKLCIDIRNIESQNVFFDKLIHTFENEESATCDICYTIQDEKIAVAPCGHYCCSDCHQTLTDPLLCPHCRSKGKFVICIKDDTLSVNQKSEKRKPFLGTKMTAILSRIQEILKTSENQNKIIFFTQFSSLASRMSQTLNEEGIGCVQFKGTDAHRRLVRKEWSESKPVLILTVQDSAAGLNLQEANHVILAHPLISIGDETQAIGRAYRFGQKRKVHVWRYIMKNTVEEELYNQHLSLQSP